MLPKLLRLLLTRNFYAAAFRRRRHYVFGLSVRPSEAWNTLFWLVHGSVGPSDQPWPFYGLSVRLSVRPSGEVSGHLPENAWMKWPEILHPGSISHWKTPGLGIHSSSCTWGPTKTSLIEITMCRPILTTFTSTQIRTRGIIFNLKKNLM